ncbi:hypothetical protein GGF46_005438 [Coemansia sp. RSA 552]|nr:hypothetical protein GGF46_005438 [Coemansia sp. RSA 552]
MDYRIDAPQSSIVFIGNVAYGTTEEQLRRTLELAGPVVDIQLIFDPITGRAKGFGFCQYADRNIAASAIKNLNDTLVDGRNIKIGYADRGRVRRYLGTDGTSLSGGNGGTMSTRAAMIESDTPITPQPKSIEPEQVSMLVGGLDDGQMRDLIGQFRSFASVNMTKAREELLKNPALAHALLVSLEALNAVDPGTLDRIRNGFTGDEQEMMAGTGPRNSIPPAGLRPPLPPPPPLPSYGDRSPYQDLPSYHSDVQPVSAPPGPAPPSTGPSSVAEMDNTEVLKQLLSLTDEQLAQLPEDHRKQIMDLRQQLQNA